MAGHISVTFEKDTLPNAGGVRVITKIIDQGDVPPSPSPTYFPTSPSSLQYCIVGQVVVSGTEERFNRIATLSEITSLDIETLNHFRDTDADFVALGIVPNDTLEIFHTYPEYWQSDEFPGNRFLFPITNIAPGGNDTLKVGGSFPSAMTGLSWRILRNDVQIVSGSLGQTRRSSTYTVDLFRTQRYNSYFTDPIEAENFITSVKAQIQSLCNAEFQASFTDETVTFNPV